MRKALQQERLLEFAIESRWFHDIRRWKRAEEFLGDTPKAWNLDQATPEGFYQLSAMKENGVRKFTTPHSYWLAVPVTQINTDQNLIQNPGY